MSCQIKVRCGAICALVGIVLAWCAPAGGQTYYWTNPAGGIFGGASNWSPTGPPTPGTEAVFDLQSSYAVTFVQNRANAQLGVPEGNVSFDLGGYTYNLNSIVVGEGPVPYAGARLTACNGHLLANGLTLGHDWDNVGELVLSAAYCQADTARIGEYGTGMLTVRDRAVCNTSNEARVGDMFGSTGIVEIAGAGSLWSVQNQLTLGGQGSGTLTLTGGAKADTGDCMLGDVMEASGTAAVVGSGTEWNVDGWLFVGAYGSGCVTAQDGGVLTCSSGVRLGTEHSGAGTVSVSGAGSRLEVRDNLEVGADGSGRVDIEQGGVIAGGGNCDIGATFAGGQVTVSGAGSALNLDGGVRLGTGFQSFGSLVVSDGGSVMSGHGAIGYDLDSAAEVVVDGAGSAWNIGGFLFAGGHDVGAGGAGTLTVSGGGHVSVHDGLKVYPRGTVRLDAGSILAQSAEIQASGVVIVNDGTLGVAMALNNHGEVELGGSGAQLAAGSMINWGLILGHGRISSSSSFDNEDGAEIRVGQGQRLLISTPYAANSGTITLAQGTVELTGEVHNNELGNILGRGTLICGGGLRNYGDVALSNGVTSVFGDVSNLTVGRIIISGQADVTFWDDVASNGALFQVSADSSATFFGEFSGLGISGAGQVYLEADITPGASPAAIDFGGDVTLGHLSRLNIELGGKTAGSAYDQVNVAGSAALDGALAIWLIGGFLPDPGDEFEIMTYGSRSGEFADTTGWLFDGNKALVKVHGANALTLLATYQGDATLDLCVDGLDYVAWSTNYLTGGTWQEGDFNADGIADGLDYVIWSSNYQTGCPASPGAVPEPSSALVLILGICALLRRRSAQVRRRRNS